jgi:hypothetical protein
MATPFRLTLRIKSHSARSRSARVEIPIDFPVLSGQRREHYGGHRRIEGGFAKRRTDYTRNVGCAVYAAEGVECGGDPVLDLYMRGHIVSMAL